MSSLDRDPLSEPIDPVEMLTRGSSSQNCIASFVPIWRQCPRFGAVRSAMESLQHFYQSERPLANPVAFENRPGQGFWTSS